MNELPQIAQSFIQWSALTLLFCAGIGVLAIAVLYIHDRSQTTHAIRRNYPVVGHFRYFFEHLGEFFRQYLFALDRDELPFNRAERSWVYRAAKKVDTTIAFGSTRQLNIKGEPYFLNSAFPILEADATSPTEIVFGENSCVQPYRTTALVNISAMSFGAISKPAVRALSTGAREAGIWLNTGEGGLSPYHLEGGCDVVFQIGTAKYGVRDSHGALSDERLGAVAAHDQVKMFEVKLSQGAKPGKGGILPGAKVTQEIASIRGIPQGEDSISPNRHEDVGSVSDLLDLIGHIRRVTGKPVGIKLVVGQLMFFDDLFTLVQQRGHASAPDFITLDSADGGTGAAPQPLMDYMGMPLKESLPLVVDKLHLYGLRGRIRIIASGKLITPGRIAWALATGADAVTSARGFMLALGCIQALQCNKNTCPAGITTHRADLQNGLVPADKARRVAHYAQQLDHGVGLIAHSCGVPEPRGLQRHHVRIIEDGGHSVSLAERYPMPEAPLEPYAASSPTTLNTDRDA